MRYVVLAGKTLDRALAAARVGRLRAQPTDVRVLRPGSCANTAEDLRGRDLSVLEGLTGFSEESPLELFVPGRSERRRFRGIEFSVCPQEFPPGAFLEIAPYLLMYSPAQYFLYRCRSLPSVLERVLLGMELCGTYAHDLPGRPELPCTFLLDPALSTGILRRYLDASAGAYGIKAAREAAGLVLDNAYSPMETIVALEQCLPVELGGRGYPRPTLNEEIRVLEGLRHLTDRDVFMPDIYWPGTDVEYEGYVHNSAAAIEADKARLADIQALGIRVIPVTAHTMRSSYRSELLGRQIGESLVGEYGVELRWQLKVLDDPDLLHDREGLHGRLMAPMRAKGLIT